MNQPPKLPRLELNVALRRYCKHFIGIALFPPVACVAIELLHVPFGFVLPFFFAVTFCAAWPYLARRAPHAFWLVAMAVWMAGGFVGVLLLQLLRLVFGIPAT